MRSAKTIARTNRARGASTQAEVRDILLAHFTTLERDDIRSTSRGATGEDLQLSPAARKLIPYQIEIKRQKSSTVAKWMAQAKMHGSYTPLVISREDRGEFLVTMQLTEFLDLITRGRPAYKQQGGKLTTEEIIATALKVIEEHKGTLDALAKR